MHIYAKGSFNGEYEPQGNVHNASPLTHLVVLHAFGLRKDGPGRSNESLAEYTDQRFADFQIAANIDAVPALETEPAFIIDGKATSYYGKGLGSVGEFRLSRAYAAAAGLTGFIHVAQAFHVPRISRHARLRNMDSIIPENLPNVFDEESEQEWTQSKENWRKREWKAQPYVLAMDALQLIIGKESLKT